MDLSPSGFRAEMAWTCDLAAEALQGQEPWPRPSRRAAVPRLGAENGWS